MPRRVRVPGRLMLWDVGVALDIEIPSPQPEEKVRIGEVLAGIRSLWRRKRAYERWAKI
jgi:hypothetical protein